MRLGNSSFCYVAAALLIVGSLQCLQATLMAQESRTKSKVLAPTPPMGWNSWDSYGLRIDEQQFRENVEAMATKLKPFGVLGPDHPDTLSLMDGYAPRADERSESLLWWGT